MLRAFDLGSPILKDDMGAKRLLRVIMYPLWGFIIIVEGYRGSLHVRFIYSRRVYRIPTFKGPFFWDRPPKPQSPEVGAS